MLIGRPQETLLDGLGGEGEGGGECYENVVATFSLLHLLRMTATGAIGSSNDSS